jgi:hypothetical protein
MKTRMAPSVPVSSLREILEGRLARLVTELEGLFDHQLATQLAAELEQQVARISAAALDRARSEVADQLNQSARRIRQAADPEQLGATLIEAAGAFASGAALFRVSSSEVHGERVYGLPAEKAEEFERLEIPLASAAALAQAIQSRDPVTTVTTPAEVSADLAAIAGHAADGRASIYPVVTGDRVPALVYAWGSVQGPALELFTQLAAAVWSAFPAPDKLVSIAPSKAPSVWEDLSPEEQQLHLRAQRFARVQVAEMRLFETDVVQSGRLQRDLYGPLRKRIDAARESFRKTFFTACPSMMDYLHLELLRTLANDDPELLGKDYPGPMA